MLQSSTNGIRVDDRQPFYGLGKWVQGLTRLHAPNRRSSQLLRKSQERVLRPKAGAAAESLVLFAYSRLRSRRHLWIGSLVSNPIEDVCKSAREITDNAYKGL